MKKFLIISALLLFSVATNAQLFTIFGQEVGFIYVGPKIGGTYSKISNFSDMFPTFTKYRYGYQLGAVGEFGFTSKFSIQTEVEFVAKGAKSSADQRIKMNYIGIPILAKYCFKALGLKKIYAMGGTFQDIRTKGEWVDPGQTSSPLGGGFKKYDWGFSFGAGAEYPTKNGIWALDFRYNLGMTDLHDDVGESFKTRSRSFGISLSYKLNLVDLFSKLKNKNKDKNNEPIEVK